MHYTNASVTFETDDESVLHMMHFKIRAIANIYGCVHVGTSGFNTDVTVVYFSVPDRNVTLFSNKFREPIEVSITKTEPVTRQTKCYRYCSGFCQNDLQHYRNRQDETETVVLNYSIPVTVKVES